MQFQIFVIFSVCHIIVPDPIVSALVTPKFELNNHNFESGLVSLVCLVIITSLDVELMSILRGLDQME